MHSPCAAPPGVCTEYLTIPSRRPPDARPPTLSLFRVYQGVDPHLVRGAGAQPGAMEGRPQGRPRPARGLRVHVP